MSATMRGLAGRMAAGFAAVFLATASLAGQPPLVEVWRSPACGCCGQWVKHLQAHGLAVRVHFVDDTSPIRRSLGIPERLASCHTAKVNGYVLEGHVPAQDVLRLLKDKPRATGLAVPGMPQGSPGMEGPRRDAFNVLLVAPAGETSVYRRY